MDTKSMSTQVKWTRQKGRNNENSRKFDTSRPTGSNEGSRRPRRRKRPFPKQSKGVQNQDEPKSQPPSENGPKEHTSPTTVTWADRIKNVASPKNDPPPTVVNQPEVSLTEEDTGVSTKQTLELTVEQIEPTVSVSLGPKLECSWTLVARESASKDWSTKSFKPIVQINTVSDFWLVANNYSNLGIRVMQLAVMRNVQDSEDSPKRHIVPTWEDIENRAGGVCSFKIELNDAYNVWEDMVRKMVLEILDSSDKDINGLTIESKNNWAIIKIWNKNKENDLSKTLVEEVLEKYKKYSIRYKVNEPEW